MSYPFVLNITLEEDYADSQTTMEIMGLRGTSVPTELFVRSLKNDIVPNLGLLPQGVKYISSSKRIWVFERPPEQVTIEHSAALLDEITEETEQRSYDIWLPHTAYVVDLDQTYYPESIFVYALNGPLESMSDLIGVLPLSNFSTAGKLCQPHRANVGEQPSNIGEGLDLAYRMCWSSGFNMDLDANFSWCKGLRQPVNLYAPPNGQRLAGSPNVITSRWEQLTKEEVESIDDWAAPRNFERYIMAEDLEECYNEGRSHRRHYENRDIRLQHPFRTAVRTMDSIDVMRRGDWGAQGLQMAFQSAMSQATLYLFE